MHIDDALVIAKRLFLEFSDAFELEFDQDSKLYRLKTKRCQKLHPLESCLLGYENLTGNKIYDICKQIKQSPKWVLGFMDGYVLKKTKYKNLKYCEGYDVGLNIRKKLQ